MLSVTLPSSSAAVMFATTVPNPAVFSTTVTAARLMVGNSSKAVMSALTVNVAVCAPAPSSGTVNSST